jgi:hypothetical protein
MEEIVQPETTTEVQEEVVEQAPEAVASEEHVSEFTPDFSYKFNGETREIDEFWRGLIKDEETQKKVRDFVERAEAVDMHKSKSKEYDAKLQEWEPQVKQLELYRQTYENAKTPADHLELLNEIGYDAEALKDITREILRREQMPEDQKALFEQNQRAELEKRQIMAQNESVVQEFNSLLANVTQQQMSLELGKAENSAIVKAYDAANGEGSFEQLFLERGAYYTQQAGKHVPPAEVMSRIAKEFAPFLASQTSAGAQNAVQIIKPKQKSIPSVGTRNGSPTQPAISSIEDLNARYKQLTGQQ